LYQISKMNGNNYSSELTLNKAVIQYVDSDIERDFLDNMSSAVFRPMFDLAVQFEPTDKADRCTYCDYKALCGR
ncbi:MAG: hypothetical protein IKY11_00720, partial [Rikenellaceae bacterium]|nr:hypothetical protein [Rikenellaceae bacterium]